MIYIWAPYDSQTAQRLSEALGKETKCTRIKTLAQGHNTVLLKEDLVVNWGSLSCPKGAINHKLTVNKHKEIQVLASMDISVPAVSNTPKAGYLARFADHVDGYDLLEGKKKGDYYVEFVETIDEYRVHSWKGKTLLLEKREPVKKDHHPWIRACEAGWNLFAETFDHGASFLQPIRTTAHKAVSALGYDFGAVDIARRKGGGLVVFEVNSAPGLEGYEVEVYRDMILKETKSK